jgi:hypothetical protein
MNRWITVLVIFFITSIAFAQDYNSQDYSNLHLSTRSEFRSWNKSPAEGESFRVSQFSFPLSMKYSITRNIDIDLVSATIFSTAAGNSLSGMRDVKARTVMMFADDNAMISLGFNIPTGNSTLSSDELAVSTLLDDKAMRFRYVNLGEGFDVSINGGLAGQLGSIVIGAGAGYLIKGEYTLLEDTDNKYQPGSQFSLIAGTDFTERPLLFRVDGNFTYYQPDMMDEEEIYQEGMSVAVQASAILILPGTQASLSGRYTAFGTPKSLQNGSLEEDISIYGDQFDLNGFLRFPLTYALSAKALADLTIIAKNDEERNDALVTGLGAGFDYRFSRSARMSVEGRYYFGSADDGDTSLDGLSGLLSLRFAL